MNRSLASGSSKSRSMEDGEIFEAADRNTDSPSSLSVSVSGSHSVPQSPVDSDAGTTCDRASTTPTHPERIFWGLEAVPSSSRTLDADGTISSTMSTASNESTISRDVSTYLTPAELELAKSLVLDLLGWGVTPEYLIECGISSQTIFSVFTQLHLRLPTNLYGDQACIRETRGKGG